MQKTLSFFVTTLHKDFLAFCNKKLQEIGLTQGLMYFILYIEKHQNCSPGRLASDLHFDIGHTARSLDKLEQDGFITRVKNSQDKRAYCLGLTKKGGNAVAMIRDLLIQWDETRFSKIDEAERSELLRILDKLGAPEHV
ncbi:MAG: MarR family transcriptional regulator [Clostridium sp.]